MRCVIQRSGPACVSVGGRRTGAIDRGLVVLAAFAPGDTDRELEWMAHKLPALRVFEDADGRMNLSLREVGGGILLVSQFTLYGDCRKGHRPSFTGSAAPARAADLYERFSGMLRRQWPQVNEGEFGAMMSLELTNEGPVTVIIDREAAGTETDAATGDDR